MILVTGGAGYIGCVAVRQLLDKGEAVRVFDKLYFGDEGLAEVADKIDLVQGDLRTLDGAVLDGCNAVIHLAGLSNDPTAEFNPRANADINTRGTEVLADACKRRGVKRFIFASTCSIYDLGFYAPDFLRDEDSEVRPRAAYAVSNYDAERILLKMADENFCPVILRQGTVYGWSPRIATVLGVKPLLGVKESVENMVRMIGQHHQTDFLNPRYYNIQWMQLLADMEATLKRIGGVF